MKMSKTSAESLLSDLGVTIDWTKVNWGNIWAIVQALLAILVGQPTPPPGPTPVMKAGAKCDPATCDCLKAHFDCIEAIAACGSQCCAGQTPTC